MEKGEIKYGLKIWSHNTEWFGEALTMHRDGVFDFIELYVNPAVPLDEKALETLRDIPVTIHATHSHGFHEFVIGDEQLKIWMKVIRLADFFLSDVIVLHPGQDLTVESFTGNLALIDDPRIYIENMAGLDVNGRPMFGQRLEDLSEIHVIKPICFDIEKAIKAACYQRIDYKEYISKAIALLSPRYFHISGGDSTNPMDEHRDVFDSDFDLPWIKARLLELGPVRLAFETPKKDGLANDKQNMEYFRDL